MQITLHDLFDGDRSVIFNVLAGDDEEPANLSVAELKEIAIAINVLRELVIDTHKDVERAEERIERLEKLLSPLVGLIEE